MNKWVCLLRGVNVGGRNKLPMAELREVLALKGIKARTYIQSGNVAFATSQDDRRALQVEIEGVIKETFGFEVPVILRSGAEWRQIMKSSPFEGKDESRHLVVFLSDIPRAELGELKAGVDQYELSGQEVYLYCPNGYGQTKLTHSLWERRLKVRASARNWKTVKKLAELLERV